MALALYGPFFIDGPYQVSEPFKLLEPTLKFSVSLDVLNNETRFTLNENRDGSPGFAQIANELLGVTLNGRPILLNWPNRKNSWLIEKDSSSFFLAWH